MNRGASLVGLLIALVVILIVVVLARRDKEGFSPCR